MRNCAPVDRVPAKDPVRHAYRGAGQWWADGAMLAYGPLAEHLVRRCPVALRDRVVLDAGAGTGAVGTALARAGAHVVSCDLEEDMLRHNRVDTMVRSIAAADVSMLPFRGVAFDATFAGFVLNHLADPVGGMRELARVTRIDGVVLASVFDESRAPAKDAVDAVLADHGWQPPPWYRVMQERAGALATPQRMEHAAHRAGLVDVQVASTAVDVGLDDAALVVRCRFGMPQLADFLATLAPRAQAALAADATLAVEKTDTRYRPTVVELVARVN